METWEKEDVKDLIAFVAKEAVERAEKELGRRSGGVDFLNEESRNAETLRGAILNGAVKDEDGALQVKDMSFLVEESKSVFVRFFYSTFYEFFAKSVVHNDKRPGIICLGPPGVGKVTNCIRPCACNSSCS